MFQNYERAKESLFSLRKQPLLANHHEKMLTFCEHYLGYKENKITEVQYLEKIKTLIEFPNKMDYKVHSLHELLILTNLLDVLKDHEKETTLSFLKNRMQEMKVTDLETLDSYLILVYTLMKHLGIGKRYPEAIGLGEKALVYSRVYHHHYLMDYLYYFHALCYKGLNDQVHLQQSIQECMNVLRISATKSQKELFKKLLLEDFSILFLRNC